jgi:DNA repair exonuclease SbcCD nuclease subunit
MSALEDDIVLKLLHTADWHLGKRFRSFSEESEKKLTWARLAVLERILLAAERHAVDAVLCAGDLFDEPLPSAVWWEAVAECFKKRAWKTRPVFLLPGNHDPLIADSVWAPEHKFRRSLPDWVHVIDREDFEYPLANGAVLYAVPCMSKSGQSDPTESIPVRAPGDERVRIGMVHGSTFDATDARNFPIDADAAVTRGLDYLAIGDTHSFRLVPPTRLQPPTVYPGAPEPTAFDEKDPGSVAVVFITRQRRANVRAERVARWTWEEHHVQSMDALRELARRGDLDDLVMRLKVTMRVPAPQYEEAERILQDFVGTSARQGRVGVLELYSAGLELETNDIDSHVSDLPDILKSVVRELKETADKHPESRLVAQRAIFQLYALARTKAS